MSHIAWVLIGIAVFLICLTIFEKVPSEEDYDLIVANAFKEGYREGYHEGEMGL